MNTSATLEHLISKLFEAAWQSTVYHPNPEHTAMWRARRKRLSIAVCKLQARRNKQLDAKHSR